MKREELIAEARRLKKKADEIEFFISGLTGERQQIAVAELSSKVRDLRSLQKSFEELIEPLPPAEGAEEIRREYSKESMDFFKVFIKARKELCSQSPTETYSLEEAIRKAFDEFATLHAQKIADKMVSERLREELIKFDAWGYGSFTENQAIINDVDEYLKAEKDESINRQNY